LSKVAKEVKQSWSGSNLGYHARVYYRGLKPKPPNVEFSTEWGLKDVWPTHQPDPGWEAMDGEAVRQEIIARAGNPSLEQIAGQLSPIRDTFFKLRGAATSILAAALSGNTKDKYLKDRLDRIEKLIAPTPDSIANTLPGGQTWSRDSLAAGQGITVAPHQTVIAFTLAATVLENGIDALKSVTEESANHIRRLLPRRGKISPSASKAVFIGHGASPLWRELKDFLKDRLGLSVDEFNRVPTAGKPTATRLSELLDAAGFAFLIMTGEDQQADGRLRARENVIHEAGLFQGKLGFPKAIILLEDGCEEFSNIHGLGQIRFPKGNIRAAFEEVRAVLEREGLLSA
jgi:predicted nucleotide-binding protein